MHGKNVLLKIENISKNFNKVKALENVSFELASNEIVGLVGDNGAGKTTLIKIISGLLKPSSGSIYINGEKIILKSSRYAINLGIETIHQTSSLVDTMNIYRNIFMGREIINAFGFMEKSKMIEEANKILNEKISIDIQSSEELVSNLSGGQKQAVAVATAMYFKQRLLLLDEPTNALSVKEAEQVLKYISQLKKENVGVIFVTHNISHVYSLADKFIILNRGKKVGDFRKENVTMEQLIKLIIYGKEKNNIQTSIK